MAYYRKQFCIYSGCNEIAERGSPYCAKHKQDRKSGNTTSKFAGFYKTSWWLKHRKAFLLHHAYCEECLKKNIHTTADTVHHSQGFCDWQTFCDISKWEAICASCHSKIHTTVTNEELYQKYNGKQD